MTITFNDLDLRPELVQSVADRGYTAPTDIQAQLIPVMVRGHDVIGQAQTGTGKTAAFALPILNALNDRGKHIQALVLAPTRELALQVTTAVFEYGKPMNVRALTVYGGTPYGRQVARLRKGVDVVVGTPGRMLDLIRQGHLDLSHVRTVVLDEADEMLSMGFIEDLEEILKATPETRQTALLSATLPTGIRKLADKYLEDPVSIKIDRKALTVSTVEQRYHIVNQRDKTAALTRLFEVEDMTSALIFAKTRIGTAELATELSARNYPAEAISGDLSQDARERVLNRFRSGHIKVLVATDVAARGLDIDDISHVYNFDLPPDPEVYVHRIGRTGRAGKSGIAISLITNKERHRLGQIERYTKQKLIRSELPTIEAIKQKREDDLLTEFEVWLKRGRCVREREIVTQLQEAGHDLHEIAAVALKLARSKEKQRPIAEIGKAPMRNERRNDRRDGGRDGGRDRGRGGDRRGSSRDGGRGGERRNGGGERRSGGSDRRGSSSRDSGGRRSHEDGMVRLSLSKGKVHGLRPNDVVGTIAYHAGIPGREIGKIRIQDLTTFVDVPQQHVEKVLSKTGSYRVQQHTIEVERS